MNSTVPDQPAPGSASAGMIRSHIALIVAASAAVKKRPDKSQTNDGSRIRGAASRVAEDARKKARRVMSPPGGTRSIGVSLVGESDVAAATDVAGTSSGSNSLILPRYSSSLADRVRQISRPACISRYSQAIYRLHNLGSARWQPFGRFGGIEIILAADNLAAGLFLPFAPGVAGHPRRRITTRSGGSFSGS